MANRSLKKQHSELEDSSPDQTAERFSKAKRNDLEPIVSEVDIKLAEKLDRILKLDATRRPIFYTNKPKTQPGKVDDENSRSPSVVDACEGKLVARNLTKDQLKERLIKRYETLVPELDPKRPAVKLVKILSVGESVELAKSEAKRQMDRQMELGSVSGNQYATRGGFEAFNFNDGYERPRQPVRSSYKISSLISARTSHKNGTKPLNLSANREDDKCERKTVRFVDNGHQVENSSVSRDKSGSNNSGEDESTDSDCTLTDDVADEDSLTE